MNTQEKSLIENLGQYIRRSVTLKLLIILILTLLLMIPVSFIISLINERKAMRQTAINEVQASWADRQLVYGPVLTLPYRQTVSDGITTKTIKKMAHILPSFLTVEGQIEPRSLHRGIYEVVVYNSQLTFSGNFTAVEKHLETLEEADVLWEEAFLTLRISDLRGIKEKVVINWNGTKFQTEPGTGIPKLIESGVTANSIFEKRPDLDVCNFQFILHLQGSEHLGFAPLGKETLVTISSDWPDPSFSGSFLPDSRAVNEDGFKASYRILELNRNYPQFWTDDEHHGNIEGSTFGVDLLLPVNDYQKAMRSAKYALLVIALSFLSFFLIEIFNRTRIHPFQYLLIGFALSLFYILLISISEHTNFSLAYTVAAVTVITLIGLYSKAILHNVRQTLMLPLVLGFSYSFVYVTLQAQDYALLIGSIGLTAMLALTMYITRNINWYKISSVEETDSSTASE